MHSVYAYVFLSIQPQIFLNYAYFRACLPKFSSYFKVIMGDLDSLKEFLNLFQISEHLGSLTANSMQKVCAFQK